MPQAEARGRRSGLAAPLIRCRGRKTWPQMNAEKRDRSQRRGAPVWKKEFVGVLLNRNYWCAVLADLGGSGTICVHLRHLRLLFFKDTPE
jgi:hypothetical protein